MWGSSELERVGADLRYAVRQVVRRLTLALGIGANTSIFTLVDAMLLKPATWNKTDRVVWLTSFQARTGRVGSMSYPDYVAYRDRLTTLSGVLAYGGNGLSVGGSRPRRVLGGLVSGNYFDVLGIPAAIGRTFAPDEDTTPGAHPVVVLSDALWREQFGADPGAVNSIVSINGRPFTMADGPLVATVNETLARRLWPGGDPLGQRLRGGDEKEPWRDVVGLVRDVKDADLTESARGAFYVPVRQRADSPLSLVVRAAGDSAAALSSIADIARSLDGDLPLFEVQTLEQSVRRAVNLRRASASLFGVFGGLTLLLAAIGVYGVTAHSVSLRTREVGIRMSLGARATDVFRMFVRESLSLSLIGVAVGLGISAAVSKLMTAVLFGLTSMDTVTFIDGSTILCLVVAAASYIPARRAALVDPLSALRHE